MKRRRWRRIAMWAGLAACGACLALMAISPFVSASILVTWPSQNGSHVSAGLGIGSIEGFSLVNSGESALLRMFTEESRWKIHIGLRDDSLKSDRLPSINLKPHYFEDRTGRNRAGAIVQRVLIAPLWIPLLILAVPTFFLWRAERRDRRRAAAGACIACGYDLTGNVTGRCPECGAAAEDRAILPPQRGGGM